MDLSSAAVGFEGQTLRGDGDWVTPHHPQPSLAHSPWYFPTPCLRKCDAINTSKPTLFFISLPLSLCFSLSLLPWSLHLLLLFCFFLLSRCSIILFLISSFPLHRLHLSFLLCPHFLLCSLSLFSSSPPPSLYILPSTLSSSASVFLSFHPFISQFDLSIPLLALLSLSFLPSQPLSVSLSPLSHSHLCLTFTSVSLSPLS